MYITLLEVRFVYYSLSYARIFKHVLTNICIHLENIIGRLSLCRGMGIRAALCGAITLFRASLRHGRSFNSS